MTVDELRWLGPYLKEQMTGKWEDVRCLLNTVLVFARARTSTFQNMSCWAQVAKLCHRLNATADKVGASHHKIELVRRGPTCFFVVCSNSPRFIWNVFLSHRDMGKNLDYFAAGHIKGQGSGVSDNDLLVLFVERHLCEAIVAERVSWNMSKAISTPSPSSSGSTQCEK